MYMSNSVKMGDAGSFTNAAQILTFINSDASKQALIEDGGNRKFLLRKESMATAACITDAVTNNLYWMSPESPALKRYVTSPGSTTPTCQSGTTDVTDCETAAAHLGFGQVQQVTTVTHPTGCSFTTGDQGLRYNIGTGGACTSTCYRICSVDFSQDT
jgi:hypothetical protein